MKGGSTSKVFGKGLSRLKTPSVCLLQHFCPVCFKGKIGISSGMRVPLGSKLIDEVQALHASKGNGLCPLDFRNPGECCSNPLLCKMNCLVCGKAMMDGTEDDFELFMDFIRDPTTEITTMFSIEDVMKSRGLTWTEQWDTPIHATCSKKTRCKCVVALGTTVCPTHCTRLDAAKTTVTSGPNPTSSRGRRIEQGPIVCPTVSKAKEEDPRISLGSTHTYRLTKADWLPMPSVLPISRPEQTVDTRKALETRRVHETMAIVRPDVKAKPFKAISKAKTSKTVILAKAAEQCAFKLDKWAGHNAHPTNAGMPAPHSKAPSKGFSLEEHARRFDIEFHGPRVRNGVKGYVRYDGVFIPTQHDVNCLNADGTLTPG